MSGRDLGQEDALKAHTPLRREFSTSHGYISPSNNNAAGPSEEECVVIMPLCSNIDSDLI
jgi:hypothetical protein